MKPAINQEVFNRFLLCLDPDRNRAGEQYETIRRKLVKFFEWRGCVFADEPADEVLNRMVEKFARGEEIRDPSTYCYGVARLVLLEFRKDYAREKAAIGELQHAPAPEDDPDQEHAFHCLGSCLGTLPAENVQLIRGYYQDDGGAKIEARKQLAERLSIPLNALRIRAHRVREKLEDCVQSCMQRKMS